MISFAVLMAHYLLKAELDAFSVSNIMTHTFLRDLQKCEKQTIEELTESNHLCAEILNTIQQFILVKHIFGLCAFYV